MAFTRCTWCGKDKGLNKHEKRGYSCTECGFIHTLNDAKSVASMSDKDWSDFQQERAIRMKYPSFISSQKMAEQIAAELKAFRDSRKS